MLPSHSLFSLTARRIAVSASALFLVVTQGCAFVSQNQFRGGITGIPSFESGADLTLKVREVSQGKTNDHRRFVGLGIFDSDYTFLFIYPPKYDGASKRIESAKATRHPSSSLCAQSTA